jgi:type IV pilus assembly protein PilM
MLAKLLKRDNTTVGLDIGTHTIKAVELRQTASGVSLVNYGAKERSPETQESQSALAATIRELLLETGIKKSKATIGLWGPETSIKRLTIPPMPLKEIKEAVRWEGKKQITFPIAQAVVDFELLGETTEDGAKKLDVIAAFAHEELVKHRVSVIEQAGLEPERITLLPLALLWCFRNSHEVKEGEVIALIDIGGEASTICLVKDGNLRSARDFGVGSTAITRAVMEALASTRGQSDSAFEEAEKINRTYGVVLDEEEGPEGDLPLKAISFRVRPVLERLVMEIERTFDFYKSQFKTATVDRVVLSGGGAQLRGLGEYLSGDLHVPTEILNPFDAIAPETENRDPAFVVAVGLALAGRGEINLVPPHVEAAKRAFRRKVALAAPAPAAALCILALYAVMGYQRGDYETKLSLLKGNVPRLQAVMDRLQMLSEEKKKLTGERALLPVFDLAEYGPARILDEIGRLIPRRVTLTKISLSWEPQTLSSGERGHGGELVLQGVAFGPDSVVVLRLSELMEGLESRPFLGNVQIVSTEKNEEYTEAACHFAITCEVQTG